ncbi:MAG: AAA family ATPase [Pirellulaceae bacterium]
MSKLANGKSVIHSEFALLATFCQQPETLSDHSDVVVDWFTDATYNATFQAIRDITETGVEYDRDIILAYLEQTGRSVDAFTVRQLFDDPVSGTALGTHKNNLRQAWCDTEALAIRARIEQACRQGDRPSVVDLLDEWKRLETGEATQTVFSGIDISELSEHADSEVDWIVDGVFSSDQVTMFGARSKCLKTTQLVDLAVSLASGSQWLGAFDIPKPRRVLFITGEANNRAISRRLKKAAVAHHVSFDDLAGMIRVEAVDFPKLPNIKHCIAIHDTVEKHGIEVVIIDPLYRGIPSDMDTNRMSQVGDAITNFTQWCRPASLIISHHVTKSAARELGSPPALEDMTGAGVAESCGNWWLVGRNEKYAWDWKHDLCVSFGGRDEQAGGRRILFDESTWTAEVTNLHEFIGEQQESWRIRQHGKRFNTRRRIESKQRRQSLRSLIHWIN